MIPLISINFTNNAENYAELLQIITKTKVSVPPLSRSTRLLSISFFMLSSHSLSLCIGGLIKFIHLYNYIISVLSG